MRFKRRPEQSNEKRDRVNLYFHLWIAFCALVGIAMMFVAVHFAIKFW